MWRFAFGLCTISIARVEIAARASLFRIIETYVESQGGECAMRVPMKFLLVAVLAVVLTACGEESVVIETEEELSPEEQQMVETQEKMLEEMKERQEELKEQAAQEQAQPAPEEPAQELPAEPVQPVEPAQPAEPAPAPGEEMVEPGVSEPAAE
jgi:outer membrane biosynthesis protein TonB